MAVRKFYSERFLDGLMLRFDKKSYCPIRQILTFLVSFLFPFPSFPQRVGFPLVFHEFIGGSRVKSAVYDRVGTTLRSLQLLGRQSRGRGTWKKTLRTNL